MNNFTFPGRFSWKIDDTWSQHHFSFPAIFSRKNDVKWFYATWIIHKVGFLAMFSRKTNPIWHEHQFNTPQNLTGKVNWRGGLGTSVWPLMLAGKLNTHFCVMGYHRPVQFSYLHKFSGKYNWCLGFWRLIMQRARLPTATPTATATPVPL